MAEGIKYGPHLNTIIKNQIKEWTENGKDVFQYTNNGIINKEAIFLSDGTYAAVHCNGKTEVVPYIGGLPYIQLADITLTPFTIRSLIARPISWVHRKMSPGSYEDVDLEKFGEELDMHGGIDFLQSVSPPKAEQVDYIRSADGKRFILRKKEGKILRL